METTGAAEPEWRPPEQQSLSGDHRRGRARVESTGEVEPEWRPQELVEPGGVSRLLSRDCSTQVKITMSWKWIVNWTKKKRQESNKEGG